MTSFNTTVLDFSVSQYTVSKGAGSNSTNFSKIMSTVGNKQTPTLVPTTVATHTSKNTQSKTLQPSTVTKNTISSTMRRLDSLPTLTTSKSILSTGSDHITDSIISSFNTTVLDNKTTENFPLTSENKYFPTTMTATNSSLIKTNNISGTESYVSLKTTSGSIFETNFTTNSKTSFTALSEITSEQTSGTFTKSSSSIQTSTLRTHFTESFNSTSKNYSDSTPEITVNMSSKSILTTTPKLTTSAFLTYKKSVVPTFTTSKSSEQTFTLRLNTSSNAIRSTFSVPQNTVSSGAELTATQFSKLTSTGYYEQTSTLVPTTIATRTSKNTQPKTLKPSTVTKDIIISSTTQKLDYLSTDVSFIFRITVCIF